MGEGRALALVRREEVGAAALAAAVGALLVAAVPPGGDTAAHLYRTLLAREGVYVWDTLWYGGHYPFLSYSLLYYAPASAVGNVALVLAAAAAAGALFASVAIRAWGEEGRWPARAFAALAPVPFVLGQFPYLVALAPLLATLRALQGRRLAVALACAGLTLALSPLAFAFLCLVLAAAFAARPRLTGRVALAGAGVASLGGGGLALAALFPAGDRYFFDPPQLLAVLAVCAPAAALALRGGRSEVLAAFFVLWAAASVVAFLVPTPVGVNVTRLRWLAFPLVLATALLVRFRPRPLAAVALAAAVAVGLVPQARAIHGALHARSNDPAFWAPALAFLRAHADAEHRVEVVETAAHWESYYLPRAGFPLARGWYRQLDLAGNEVLYERPLAPDVYEAWLRARGVRYVLLPPARIDERGGAPEAELLRSGRAPLVEVARTRGWRIFELPDATPLLTGPAPARLTALGRDRVGGWTAARGVYRLRLRYTPHWERGTGALCLRAASDGSTLVEVRRPGRFLLVAALARGSAEC